jgi:hypothetical protein
VIRVKDSLWQDSAAAAALIRGARIVETPAEWRYGIFDAQPEALGGLMLRELDLPPLN